MKYRWTHFQPQDRHHGGQPLRHIWRWEQFQHQAARHSPGNDGRDFISKSKIVCPQTSATAQNTFNTCIGWTLYHIVTLHCRASCPPTVRGSQRLTPWGEITTPSRRITIPLSTPQREKMTWGESWWHDTHLLLYEDTGPATSVSSCKELNLSLELDLTWPWAEPDLYLSLTRSPPISPIWIPLQSLPWNHSPSPLKVPPRVPFKVFLG